MSMNHNYDLEIVMDKERANLRMEALQTDFPDLQVVHKSRFFIILWSPRETMLSDQEKQYLEDYIERGVIHRFRCKQRKYQQS